MRRVLLGSLGLSMVDIREEGVLLADRVRLVFQRLEIFLSRGRGRVVFELGLIAVDGGCGNGWLGQPGGD
jgi:hypothetical protein